MTNLFKSDQFIRLDNYILNLHAIAYIREEEIKDGYNVLISFTNG